MTIASFLVLFVIGSVACLICIGGALLRGEE